jgi:hypothetical protein
MHLPARLILLHADSTPLLIRATATRGSFHARGQTKESVQNQNLGNNNHPDSLEIKNQGKNITNRAQETTFTASLVLFNSQ